MLVPLFLALGSALSAPTPPDGFVRAEVAGVAPSPMGPAVLLTVTSHERVVPIWVGESEAATISLRSSERDAPRPMTHDLLDRVAGELGGRFVAVRIDALEGRSFTAEVDLTGRKKAVHTLDARASDAIAIALGHGLPIWLATVVKEEAGVDPTQLPPSPAPGEEIPRL